MADAAPAGRASHTINTLRGSIGTHLQPGEWKAIENALQDYGNMTAKRAQADLLAALNKTLEAFKNVMPTHLYKNGCFNWETQPDPCPCTAHVVRRAIAAAEKAGQA